MGINLSVLFVLTAKLPSGMEGRTQNKYREEEDFMFSIS